MRNIYTRAEYEAERDSYPESARWQFWPVPWKFATVGERCMKMIYWALGAVAMVITAVAALSFIGMTIETYAQYQEEKDRCLTQATNGYEIRRCN